MSYGYVQNVEAFTLRYRHVVLIYTLLIAALMSPYWFQGEVVSPHRQLIVLGNNVDTMQDDYSESHLFNDYVLSFIPDIDQYLHAPRSGWLVTWTKQNELGRPLYHLTGFSAAYPPSWVLTNLVDDPWVFVTFLSTVSCFFAGLFIIFYCREIGLSPQGGLVAGFSLGSFPTVLMWLTFPMFISLYCWGAGILWGMARLNRKRDLIGWLALALSVYSLLLLARKQEIVTLGYLIIGYAIYLSYCKWRDEGRDAFARFLFLTSSAALMGVVLVAPVFADLMLAAAESGRTSAPVSFFKGGLPHHIHSLGEFVRALSVSVVPEVFGNPMEKGYPFARSGIRGSLLLLFFAIASLQFAFRKTWGWWFAILILFIISFNHPIYEFLIKYLGYSFSRSNPLGALILPLIIIVAYGVDSLVKQNSGKTQASTWFLPALTGSVLLVAVVLGVVRSVDIQWWNVFAMLLVIFLLAMHTHVAKPLLLVSAMIVSLFVVSQPLMLKKEPGEIAKTSNLVEKIREQLSDGGRYAVAAPIGVLHPNINAELNLSSIHSYNSLSPKHYHELIKSLNGSLKVYGRRNAWIAPDYDSVQFWMSDISLMLSPTPLNHENLALIDMVALSEEVEVYLYKVLSRMGTCIQAFSAPERGGENSDKLIDPRQLSTVPVKKTVDLGDVQAYEVEAVNSASTLIVSQTYHPFWQAEVYVNDVWVHTDAFKVNGVFQGVLLPPGSERVRIEYKPFVRYAWIAHVFWLLCVLLFACEAWRRRFFFRAEAVG